MVSKAERPSPALPADQLDDRELLVAAIASLKQLDLAAKTHHHRPATLLAFLEPPAGLSGASPVQAFAAISAQEVAHPQVREALALLAPEQDLEAATAARRQVLQLFRDLIGIGPTQRIRRREELSKQLHNLLVSWPSVVPSLCGPSIRRLETLCRETIGEEWTVPAFTDARHSTEVRKSDGSIAHFSVREQLFRDGQPSERVSPLQHYLLCPMACRDCWARLRKRLRLVQDRLGPQPALHIVRQAIMDVLRSNGGTMQSSLLVQRVLAKCHCGETTVYAHLTTMAQPTGLLVMERPKPREGKSRLVRLR